MRRLFLLAFLTARGWAALTTVTQTVKGPDGLPANGTAYIRITNVCVSGADYIGDKTLAVRFSNGAFAVALVPNDGCVPSGTSYTVSWQLGGGKGWNETWVVPTSASPVTIDAVRTEVPPPVTVKVHLSQLDLGAVGPAKTYCLAVPAGATTAVECAPGGGSLGKTWNDLMSTTWNSLQ